MKSRHLEEKTEHIDALSNAVATLDQQLQQTLESEQHDMIEHLDEYIDTVETRLASVRAFCKSLREDLRKGSASS